MNQQHYHRGKSFLGLIISEQYRRWKFNNSRMINDQRHRLPMMRMREILLLEELLGNLQPSNCLEWGSGYSTLYYPQFSAPGVHWTAIEHDSEWAERIENLNTEDGVKVIPIQPQQFPWTDANDDGAYGDLRAYVDYGQVSKPYDFILVDGRARIECLNKAYEWIAEKGVVVLHDSMRPYYHGPLTRFPYQVKFDVVGKTSQGLWLGSKSDIIENYVNVSTHERLWSMHNRQRRKRQDKQAAADTRIGGRPGK